MKIYLFSPETGIYQGEDFADDPPLCPGRDALPHSATTIAPPTYQRGEVPVFSISENKWEIRPVSALVPGGGSTSCEQAGLLAKDPISRKAG